MTDPATLVSLAQNVTDLVAAYNADLAKATVSANQALSDAATAKTSHAAMHVAASQLIAAVEAEDPTPIEPTPAPVTPPVG